jgi:hypothetical protein
MKKIGLFIIPLILLLVLTGCISSQARGPAGLQITGMSSSIGGVEGQLAKQKFNYTFTVQNNGSQEIFIQSMSPVLSTSIAGKVLNEQISVPVNKAIAPEQRIDISDELWLDTRNLSKEEIVALEPFITGINLNSTLTLGLP